MAFSDSKGRGSGLRIGEPAFRPASDRVVAWLSFSTMFIVGTDTFLVAPLLPELRDQFHVSTGLSGWLVSAYALGYAFCALIAGPISDRADRRRVLLAGMFAFTVLTGACGLAWDFWSMAALRFLTGVAAALAAPQIWASIPQLVGRDQVVRTLGRATAGLSIAQLAGIPIGSFLAATTWRLSFLMVAIVATIVTLSLVKRFPSVTTDRTQATGSGHGYTTVLASGSLVVALIAYFVFQTGNFAALSFYASWFARDFGLHATGIGIAMVVIGAGNATGSLLGHKLVARWGIPRSLQVGIGMMALGYLAVALTRSVVPAVALLAITMMAAGFVFPVMMAILQSHAGNARGTVSSLANVAMYAGTTIGVAIAGPVFAATSQFTGLAAVAILSYLTALLLFSIAGATRQ